MSPDPNNFILRPISSNDDTKKLSLGNPIYTPLKIFLKKDAYDFHQFEIAKTYVLVEEVSTSRISNSPRIWAYITLMNSEIDLTGISNHKYPQETLSALRYTTFPAVKIARLAVDKDLQGKGMGKTMLLWTINYVRLQIMPSVGCRFLAVDSKQQTIDFYKKNGFNILETESNLSSEHPLMFFDLYKCTKDING